MKTLLKSATIFLFLGFGLIVYAASQPKLEISPKQANVGDLIKVKLTFPGTDPGDVTLPNITDKLGDFTVLSTDTLGLSNKKKKRQEEPFGVSWTVSAYDTGKFSTGDLSVNIAGDSISLPSVQAQIVSVIKDSSDSQFRPLKAQMELPFTFKDFVKLAYPYAIALAVLVGLFFLIRWLIKRRHDNELNLKYEKPKLPPYDEAIAALRVLQKDNPLNRGDLKGYVSSLAEILKRLLERVHEAPVLEMTTWEVRKWSHENTLRSNKDELLRLLSDSDMVKFAKVTLAPEHCDELMNITERFIAGYKPAPLPSEKDEKDDGSSDDKKKNNKAENSKSLKAEETLQVRGGDE